jgi:hypothetical protein
MVCGTVFVFCLVLAFQRDLLLVWMLGMGCFTVAGLF